ncbi:arginine/serine-rich coiled-coil protein 2 isoform X2 [Fopius arisanus]|nr:PREDICTED: arginine/serine-rich coiled-coil protein 2 isoform X2 [Fopius arisanus]XP_011311744.1 PREDICTED: arginine/serine-rich coiled-coil protein 2 isoform X2 [Fopius arisanus]XP_011311745.1 PREDICTED: arginine/serine-rich coiled-coil protein 2 isoform X2 [Fopius arisanus]
MDRRRQSPEQRRTPEPRTPRDSSKQDRADRLHQEVRSRRESDDRRHDTDMKDSRDRKSRSNGRRSRDDDRRSSKNISREESRRDERDRSDKDHHRDHHRNDRRDRRRERNRRHSRSDRKDRYRDDRSSHHKDKDRERVRSRSRSKDKPVAPFRPMSYREEKGRSKLAQLEKLGIELKTPDGNSVTPNLEHNFYNPLATATQGKYAEQIQKRKLLWANKAKSDEGQAPTTAIAGTNTWVGTTFTHDQDGKMTAKFKRLMGIKGDAAPAAQTTGSKPDILKKQEEMFNNMEQQYEVARATTHTQRGVGLGYASGTYQFPR